MYFLEAEGNETSSISKIAEEVVTIMPTTSRKK